MSTYAYILAGSSCFFRIMLFDDSERRGLEQITS